MISKSLEEYLKTMYILQQKNGNIRVTDIAEKMNCSKPSVNKAINNLKDNKLVNYELYGTIELTKEGEDLAKKILETYDIVLLFLKDVLGIEAEKAKAEAEKMKTSVSDETFDLNYIGGLYGQKSNIDIEVQGALKDNAKKHFKGTIDFKKGCKRATGNENENCMLLSDTAKSLALPMLLCSEEDVEGNHSSSAGKIGEKELFYIMSRGFELKEAMKLMVRAKFNKILKVWKMKN